MLDVAKKQSDLNKILSLLLKKNYIKAKSISEKKLKSSPNDVDLLHTLGVSLFHLNRNDEAVLNLNKAVRISKNNRSDILNSLAQVYRRTDLVKAKECLEKVVELNPSPAYLSDLATVQSQLGFRDKAILTVKRSLMIDNNYLAGLKLLCQLLLDSGRFLECLEFVDNIPKNDADYYKLSIDSYIEINSYSQAIALLNELLQTPNLPDKYLVFAIETLITLGEFERAKNIFLTSTSRKLKGVLDLKLRLEELSEAEHLQIEKKVLATIDTEEVDPHIIFNLAKFYKRKNRAKWIYLLELANKKKDFVYNEKETLDLFDRATVALQKRVIPTTTIQSSVPIFIIGMPRSGTTLTESIIGAHSNCFACGESKALQISFNKVNFNEDVTDEKRLWTFIDLLEKSEELDLTPTAMHYLKLIRKHDDKAKHLVNKMPHNFVYTALLPRLFPQAKFIHITRNPIANILSIFEQNFGRFHSYGNDLSTLVKYYKKYQEYMEASLKLAPKGSVYSLQYENLIENTEDEVRKLLGYCNLPFEQSCLEFNKQKRVVKTASVKQVREAIYKTSLKPWQGLEEELGVVLDAFPEYK